MSSLLTFSLRFKILLLFTQFSFFAFSSKAQLPKFIVSPADVTVGVGDTVSIDITVENFIAISAFQGGITWDRSILSFVDITNINYTSFVYNSNFPNYPTGLLLFLAFSLADQSLNDGDVLWTMRFVAQTIGSSTIEIGDIGQIIPLLVTHTVGNANIEEPPCVENGIVHVSSCSLQVDCSNILSQNFTCLENVPTPDLSLPIVNLSCGISTVSVDDSFTNNSGCQGDPITYTRIYTIQDESLNETTCTQIFTIEDTDDLQVNCQQQTMVSCETDIIVSQNDLAVLTSCGLNFSVEIFGPNLTGPPNCDGTIYAYRYQVTDDCARIAVCTREFLLSNPAPTIQCLPGQTVECAEDIIKDNNQVLITSSCGVEPKLIISDPEITGLPNCSSSTYAYTYTVSDLCGRMASCSQVWIIDNFSPQILECAPDQMVECSSDIMPESDFFLVEVSCGLDYQITSGPIVALDNLGDCPGATYTISYELRDACDRAALCTQTFTVDNRAPRIFPEEDQIISCRDEIVINWDNCMVETDCNLGIVGYEIIGPIEEKDTPDCNGKIINYLYSVWDGCGRMTCVAQAWTIQNEGPTFDQEPIDLTVDCTSIPDSSLTTASYGGCGSIGVEVISTIFPLAGLNYELHRRFTAVDECGNIKVADQIVTVLCNEPSGHQRYCSLEQEEWGDGAFENEEGITTNNLLIAFNLEKESLKIGITGNSIIVKDLECILEWLPAEGLPEIFPSELGNLVFNKDNCSYNNPFLNKKGQLSNTLLGETIALKLNLKKLAKLKDFYLTDLCIEVPSSSKNLLPETPTVADVEQLADKTLSGLVEIAPSEIESLAKAINTYFADCNTLNNCEETIPNDKSVERHNDNDSPFKKEISNLILSPNPAMDDLKLHFQLVKKSQSNIHIYNTSGVLQYKKRISPNRILNVEMLDISNWPIGVYMVVLSNEEEVIVKKLIKQQIADW